MPNWVLLVLPFVLPVVSCAISANKNFGKPVAIFVEIISCYFIYNIFTMHLMDFSNPLKIIYWIVLIVTQVTAIKTILGINSNGGK